MTEAWPDASILSAAGWDALRGQRIPMADVAFTLASFPDYITIESAQTTRRTGKQYGNGGNVNGYRVADPNALTDDELNENLAWLRGAEAKRETLRARIAELQPLADELEGLKHEHAALLPGASGKTERFSRLWDTAQELLRRELEKK